MSGFCGGSNGAGALTQLIAQGAIDQYLSQGASFTFWKVKYNKHTNFALESISQPFNTAGSFGSESQITLNRNGDLVYFQYIVIDLPGITACCVGNDCTGIQGANQFPYCGQPCNPCQDADRAVMEDYVSDGYSEASAETKKEKLRNAKNRWNRDKYGACTSLECCEEADDADCPTNICGEETWCHWTNDIGQFLGLAQQAMGLVHHLIAERGEAHHAPAALHQRHAEQRFELADPGAERRLRHETRLRRTAEMPVLM